MKIQKNINDALGLPETGYIRQSQLIPDILPFSAATLWRLVKAKKFPAPIKLSKRVTAWKAIEIKEWLNNLHNSEAA
jgi:prophage regulatory protein